MVVQTVSSFCLEGLGRKDDALSSLVSEHVEDPFAEYSVVCIFHARSEVKFNFVLAWTALMMNSLYYHLGGLTDLS